MWTTFPIAIKDFDSDEFKLYPKLEKGVSFHNAGDYLEDGSYLSGSKVNDNKCWR